MRRSGVYAVIDKLTTQGFDMQFGTNVLGTERLYQRRSFSETPTCRPLLFHQIAPSRSHRDRKELSSWIGARRQRQLPRPQRGPVGGYPMVYAHPRR